MMFAFRKICLHCRRDLGRKDGVEMLKLAIWQMLFINKISLSVRAWCEVWTLWMPSILTFKLHRPTNWCHNTSDYTRKHDGASRDDGQVRVWNGPRVSDQMEVRQSTAAVSSRSLQRIQCRQQRCMANVGQNNRQRQSNRHQKCGHQWFRRVFMSWTSKLYEEGCLSFGCQRYFVSSNSLTKSSRL